jgi:hypothetical protein
MIVSSLIIAVSLVLFLYWFRYTCILILNTRTTRDYTLEVAAANDLQFTAVPAQLDLSTTQEMDHILDSLERDYTVVNGLLKKAGNVEIGGDSIEEIMLRMDFRIMSLFYGVSRRFSDSMARRALDEMSQIVAHFANTCGERAEESAAA